MPARKILVTEPASYDEECISLLSELGRVKAEKLGRKELEKAVADVEVLVVRVETRVDRKLLDKAKKLRVIATATTGLDHIDTAHAEERGVDVVYLDDPEFLRGVDATIEHTFALMLALARKIPWAFDSVRKKEWRREEFFGSELHGKTLGLVGFGRVAVKVARIAQCFGMKVLAFDPYVNEEEMLSAGVEPAGLRTLLEKSDVVSLHPKLTEETEEMVGKKELGLMKKTAMLINTSRGRVVDEEALLSALKKKRLAGAAVDVLSSETEKDNPLAGNPLIDYAKKNKNLIITPHIAGSTKESMNKTGVYVIMKVKELLG